jgi:hypothetical protein
MIWTARPERIRHEQPPAGLSYGTRTLTLSELRGWTLLIAGASYWGGVVRTFRHEGAISLVSIAQSVLSDGAFNVAGWAMIGAWAYGIAPRGFASRRQIAGALAICLLFGLPTRQATIAGLLVLGLTLAVTSVTRHGRLVATLLIALAIEMIWTSTYLLPLHTAVATFDAQVCSAILGLTGEVVQAHGNMLENARAGINVEILAFCASSFPLGGVAMAFLVVMFYWGRFPRFADLSWIAAALLCSVALTELRLSLMALGEANYVWLHDGDGGTLYTLCATALAVLFPTLAMRRSRPARELVV